MRYSALIVALVVAMLGGVAARGADGPVVGVVSHVKVVSDKVQDISNLEVWKKNHIKPGMTEQEKAIECFKTVVGFEHEMDPPQEFIQFGNAVADPVKTFNVYGYNACGPGASNFVALARCAGLKARGWSIQGHTVAEVWYDNAWHMFDASYINYFPKEDGVVASVAEIMAEVKAWYEKNPGYKGDAKKLAELRASENRQGWKTKGPALLARCPFYSERGFLPATLMDWHHTMRQYDGTVSFEYETGSSLGYEVNVQLRPGEKLIRNWSHKDLHINMLFYERKPLWLTLNAAHPIMAYAKDYGDLAPARLGNGTLLWDVPVGDAKLEYSAVKYENLRLKEDGEKGPALTLKDPAKDGVLELQVASPYILLSGGAGLKAVIPEAASIVVGFSENNGKDWVDLPLNESLDQMLSMTRLVHRRYGYLLRFTIHGKGAGIDKLKLVHDVQHSQRPLPILTAGENTIHFSAGPAEGTVTIEPSLDPKCQPMQVIYTDFSPQKEGIQEREGGGLGVAKDKGTLAFPIETPGNMKQLRISTFYRTREVKDSWAMEVSFDKGKTWEKAGEVHGPGAFGSSSLTVDKVPAAARQAMVRWSGTQVSTAMIFNLRIDADYEQPHGGFRPVKITYNWEEGGTAKSDVHVAKQADETYKITCGEKTVCKNVIVELAE